MNDEPDQDPYRIEIARSCNAVALEDEPIRQGIRAALGRGRCRSAEISVAVVTDAEIAELNRRYLGRDEPTDVLAFTLDRDDEGGVSGEIVVSAETARRCAAEYHVDPRGELMLYILHGLLHLLGYEDQTPQEAARMHAAEDDLLAELGYGRVYGVIDE